MTEKNPAENGTADKTPGENTHAGSVLKIVAAMQRAALVYGTVASVVGITASVLLAGWPGLLGSAVGAAVGMLSALATLWLMRRTAAFNPQMLMAAMLGGFLAKMLLLFVTLTPLRGIPELHTYSLAFTLLGVVLLTATMEFLAFRKTKVPTIIPAAGQD